MKKLLLEEKKVTKVTINKIVNNEELSKSQRIKDLFDLGLEVKEISNLMNIRYNFAYNVISNYITIESIEVVTNKKESKKDKIIELYLENKSMKEISIELKTNYNYVFNTLKKYKNEKEVTIEKEVN